MGQDKENQPFAFTNSAPNAIWQSRTVHTPAPLPLLISKKWLCIHFNLIGPGGKANTEALANFGAAHFHAARTAFGSIQRAP